MRVLVTQEIDPAGIELLSGHEIVQYADPAPIPRGILLEKVRGCDALICMLADRIDAAVLDAGPLRVVANHAVGTDNVDLSAARERGVVVTNTPGVLTEATADLAFALLLAAARHIVAGDRMMREGRFLGWRPTLLRGLELSGSRLGIVGFGRIGKAVARRAEAFGMEVVWSDVGAGMPLDELLRTSDAVSLHCPLTPATRHLLDEPALRSMKPGAVLVNTSRGPVVDEAALARALREGWIAAAGLDVYEAEPRVHPDLLGLDNVVLAPHLGSATFKTRRQMAVDVARNVLAVAEGREPPARVV